MYLLILYAFLHMADLGEHVVVAHFQDRDACLAQAAKLNHVGPNTRPRQPGDVFICARIVFL